MFFVNYNAEGKIISYTGAPDASHNDVPENCLTLKFASDIPGFINSNGVLMMKVDVEKKLLVFLHPATIPSPIE